MQLGATGGSFLRDPGDRKAAWGREVCPARHSLHVRPLSDSSGGIPPTCWGGGHDTFLQMITTTEAWKLNGGSPVGVRTVCHSCWPENAILDARSSTVFLFWPRLSDIEPQKAS